ncbi:MULTISPECIES: ABC transporter permease [Streptomyces]|uniref:ABC transporter permease n=1 Tax=Streptomyces TaxID=1883 RepID=UPI00163C9068|nr:MULTISPECIES: ABC transporter permease [Streptomyces]MBC2876136.1 ABC transporter permease [Streptomyces sp. TYQ1024]UBI38493.1 ABC transporter permease [Streptomyces mobaraensis]UKW31077.1 ABC transporter permease [Streptomyces sp. TYQ1024]
MFRTALRNVLAHKARLLMTVLAVMLGVAFVSGTLVFTETFSSALQSSSQKGFADVDVAVQPHKDDDDKGKPGEPPMLTQRLLDKAAKVPGAASATGSVDGQAYLAGKDGELVGSGFARAGSNYFPGKDGTDARYPLTSGRAPQRAGEIAVDAKTAERAGFKVGDTVRMSVRGPVLSQKITGVFTTDKGQVSAGGTLTLFDTATAQKLFAKPGRFNEIDVKAAPGTSQEKLKAEVDKILPRDAEATTGKKLADDEAEMIAQGMDGVKTGLLVFAGIALFVGIFIIANTFTMLIAQRTKELALLRAVGASRRQVTRSVLVEAFVVGAVAAVAGLLAGIGIGAGMKALMPSDAMPAGPLVVPPSAIVSSLAVGILVTMLAAWLPGRRAAKIPPVAAMNSVHAVATTKSLVVRNTIGALLTAAGAAVSVTAGDESGLGVGAGLLLIGVFVLTPLLSRPLIAAVGPVLRRFGMPGKLAGQNAVRNPRRTAATASALMIGLTLITGLTVIGNSVQQAIDKMAADSLKADYVVVMANMHDLSPDIARKLATQPGVTAVSALRQSPARIDGDSEYLTGVDAASIGKLTQVDFSAGSYAALSQRQRVVVDDATAKSHHWKAGSSFEVTYEDGKKGRLTVGGIFKGNDMLKGIMVDNPALTPHMSELVDRQVLVKTDKGASASAKKSLRKALGDNPAIQVQDKDDISREVASMISMMLNVLYGLLAMAVIVAVLGVVNTLAMSVFERRQEIGMLRAIGLDRSGIKRMVRLESVVISLFGGVLGIVLGVFFGWAAGEQIATSMATYEMALPWGRIALFLLLAAVVGVLAALWPARRAAKLNMLSAIKAD